MGDHEPDIPGVGRRRIEGEPVAGAWPASPRAASTNRAAVTLTTTGPPLVPVPPLREPRRLARAAGIAPGLADGTPGTEARIRGRDTVHGSHRPSRRSSAGRAGTHRLVVTLRFADVRVVHLGVGDDQGYVGAPCR